MLQKDSQVKIPKDLLAPIKTFFREEIARLRKQERNLKKADPFSDASRATENSLEEDVDEQIGHFDSQIKVNFVKKQIVQFRKALTTIKIGRYGVCEHCQKMIDTDRLAIRPETTLCIDCEKEKDS